MQAPINTEQIQFIDNKFNDFLKEQNQDLYNQIKNYRQKNYDSIQTNINSKYHSELLLSIAPYLDEFIAREYNISAENDALAKKQAQYDVIYIAKKRFVERFALAKYKEYDLSTESFEVISKTLKTYLVEEINEKQLASKALDWLEDREKFSQELKILSIYTLFMIKQNSKLALFDIAQKTNQDNKIREHRIKKHSADIKTGFDYRGFNDLKLALGQAKYCIYCHKQSKDYCSIGIDKEKQGCPLDQKISEMNNLFSRGFNIGALAMMMVDNPLALLTGHRICNDCIKSCIFQKQDAVDVPLIESSIVDNILSLPWGAEIYYLLLIWNPLIINNDHYFKQANDYNILVVGQGPAGIALSYYLAREGFNVSAIDGMKIEKNLYEQDVPIKDFIAFIKDQKSEDRITMSGYGGVAGYGITARWDKNKLNLLETLMRRFKNYKIYDSTRLGSNITLENVKQMGFDHVALAIGAGKPNYDKRLDIGAKNVTSAANFLMQINQYAAHDKNSNSRLNQMPIRLPLIVYGLGLTAVDAAVEFMHYYPQKVMNFANEFRSGEQNFDYFNKDIIEEYLAHADIFFKILDDAELSEHGKAKKYIEAVQSFGGVKLLYRKNIIDSAAYKLNIEEIEHAISSGVEIITNAEIEDTFKDDNNLIYKVKCGANVYDCGGLLIAIGTHHNEFIDIFESDYAKQLNERQFITHHGDCNEKYHGSVVKALASVKDSYKFIIENVSSSKPLRVNDDLNKQLDESLKTIVIANKQVGEYREITLKSKLASENFKAGQFYKLQNYSHKLSNTAAGVALCPINVCKDSNHMTFIIYNAGKSTAILSKLNVGEEVALLGPVGAESNSYKENEAGQLHVIIGSGLSLLYYIEIARALKNNGHQILLIYSEYEDKLSRYLDQLLELVDYSYFTHDFTEINVSATINDKKLIDFIKKADKFHLGSDDYKSKINILNNFTNLDCKNKIVRFKVPMECMMKGICGRCIVPLKNGEHIFACTNNEIIF